MSTFNLEFAAKKGREGGREGLSMVILAQNSEDFGNSFLNLYSMAQS